ncbi:uncharacterized protein LOC113561695 [Ooceraea biroi]|uniref:uncharacterized protein LOC113561695 n=1 Tax=Ooceraea biroi TaxID=2015173 RepID=UPI000F07A381|nr:uncharacterized protein LOC113561695 [Ooceraea biroi]
MGGWGHEEIEKRERQKRKDGKRIMDQNYNKGIRLLKGGIWDSTCFVFDGQYYQQIFGSPMSSPLSPILADMVLDDLETSCIGNLGFDRSRLLHGAVEEELLTYSTTVNTLDQLQEINIIYTTPKYIMEGAGRLPESMSFDGNLSENFKRFYQSLELYLTATEKDRGSTRNYCAPRKNRTYERFVFNNRSQGTEEPFDQFLGDLKKLIQSREYADQEDTILVDRIILGVNDVKVQEKLLTTQNTTLENAIEVCRNFEATKKQLRSVRNKEEIAVDFIKKKRQESRGNEKSEDLKDDEKSRRQFKCSKCGKVHGVRECPAFGKTCYKCEKMNHFNSMCKAKIKDVKDISRSSDVELEGENFYEYKSIVKDQRLQKTHIVLQAYGGTKITPIGTVNLRCKNVDKSEILEFLL